MEDETEVPREVERSYMADLSLEVDLPLSSELEVVEDEFPLLLW